MSGASTYVQRTAPWWRIALNLIEAGVFYAVMGLFRVLGVDRASALGGAIARTIGPLLPVSRRAHENLMLALPHLSAAERERIVRAMWDNLGRTFAEYPHFDAFHGYEPGGRLTVVDAEIADAALARGKGTIFFSGHFANWELMPMAARHRGYEGVVVYRPPNNPYVDQWMVRQRSRYTFPALAGKGTDGTRAILNTLRKGQPLMTLIDQKMNEGVPVPFFGHDAMTAPAAAHLAIKYGSPLVPVGIRREKGAHFTIRVYPEIALAQTGDRIADTIETTRRLNVYLEDRIRECPEQWLWLHRRWPKTVRPASAPREAADRAAPETS